MKIMPQKPSQKMWANAGKLSAQIIKANQTLDDLANVIHSYPFLVEYNKAVYANLLQHAEAMVINRDEFIRMAQELESTGD